jgi:Cd2+/Zn2+-exporting ATPase
MSATTVELELDRDAAGCGDCAQRLRGALGEHDGVRAVAEAGDRLLVELDDERCSGDCLRRALADASSRLAHDYAHTIVAVDGMDCASCARTVSSAVGRLDGVSGVEVSFTTGRMLVEHAPGGYDGAAVARRVGRLGYSVRDEGAGADGADRGADGAMRGTAGAKGGAIGADRGALARIRALARGDLLTLISTALLLIAVVVDLATDLPAAWLYGAAVLVGIGPIARAGVVALVTTRRPEIKFLMTVASLGAVAIGAWMEAALVVVLFSIGEWLEGRAVARARRELSSLVALAPQRARVRVERPGGDDHAHTPDACCGGDAAEEREVDVAELRVGDLVVVRPGERLPADGRVAEGRSAVDQAAITGESVPVDVAPGDRVFAGTLNAQGLLAVRVERAPGDTTLARIGRLVAEAQARRAPAERWVDAFARVYTPAVIALAVLVAALPPLAWGATFDGSFYSALALLILACPCALVLSTPVTIVSALGRASAAGVLVKGGEQLERAAAIGTVAFDKTGTLTAGRPRVVSIAPLDGEERHPASAEGLQSDAPADAKAADELLAMAAALEQGSEHPLARAIVAAARERGLPLAPVADFAARPGFGATGTVGGRTVAIGKPGMFEGVDAAAPAEPSANPTPGGSRAPGAPADAEHWAAATAALDAARAAGQTAVLLTRDGAPLGVLGLADPPRAEAAEAIAQLRALGIDRTVLLTGDHEQAAQALAAATGIGAVRAEQLPADKASALHELGDGVAMVGDGVNDAPALAGATLGIAMGSAGSDTAIEVADVALMGDDPRKVAGLIGLARWTRATVRANIAFSLATKLVAAALLAAGLLPLWGAVVTDVGASLIVVLYGLRLLVATPGGRLRGIPVLARVPLQR